MSDARNVYRIESMRLAFSVGECEPLLRKIHINFMSYYLMGDTQHANFVAFNEAAIKLLGDKRIRGRRRQLLEKFVGKIAALRLENKLCMEDLSCLD